MRKASLRRGEGGSQTGALGPREPPRLSRPTNRSAGLLSRLFLALFQQLFFFLFRSLSQRPDTLKINDIIGRADWLPVSLAARRLRKQILRDNVC